MALIGGQQELVIVPDDQEGIQSHVDETTSADRNRMVMHHPTVTLIRTKEEWEAMKQAHYLRQSPPPRVRRSRTLGTTLA